MQNPEITASLGDRYDTQALIEGTLDLEGYSLRFVDAGEHPWSSFHAMVTSLPWNIGEQAFSHYLIARDQGVPITAIPAFPSRFFPQLGAVVSVASGITEPRDLEGKRVGVMGFGYNPAVWMRQILAEYYAVDLEKVIWVEDENDKFLGGLDYPKPERFRIETAGGFDSLTTSGSNPGSVTALNEGLIDAFLAPAAGPPLTTGMRKLFPNPEEEITNWLSSGGVFPINTLITLRQETITRHPDLPRKLFDIMQLARRQYHENAHSTGGDHLGISLEFLTRSRLFPDRYGLEANRDAIQYMIDSCYHQGLISKPYKPEEVILPLN